MNLEAIPVRVVGERKPANGRFHHVRDFDTAFGEPCTCGRNVITFERYPGTRAGHGARRIRIDRERRVAKLELNEALAE